MKHTVIAVVCFIAVFVYSGFTYFYVNNFTREIRDELFFIDNNEISSEKVEDIKDSYEEKKDVLYFILNKEHLENIEEYIIKLELSVEYDNRQDIETYKKLLDAAIEDVMHQNKCII